MGFLVRISFLLGLTCIAYGQTVLHVNANVGTEQGDGSPEAPFPTIEKAVMAIPETSREAITLRIHPGNYVLKRPVVLDRGTFTATQPLRIEASMLPTHPEWRPAQMPVIHSTEHPGEVEGRGKAIYGFQVEVGHVGFHGLRFKGNPAVGHRYYPIRRDNNTLKGLTVTHCLFDGDREKAPIHVAVIARGHGIVVEHNIFNTCRNPTVFWVAEGGNSFGNAYRFNIAFNSYQSGLWTTDTASDFDFRNNIFHGGNVFHMHRFTRESSYSLTNSYIVGFDAWTRLVGGPGGREAADPAPLSIREFRIFREAKLRFDLDEAEGKNRRWLHPLPGTPGAELGAGFF